VFIDQFRRHVPRYQLRHMVKSGMTGWAQIRPARETPASRSGSSTTSTTSSIGRSCSISRSSPALWRSGSSPGTRTDAGQFPELARRGEGPARGGPSSIPPASPPSCGTWRTSCTSSACGGALRPGARRARRRAVPGGDRRGEGRAPPEWPSTRCTGRTSPRSRRATRTCAGWTPLVFDVQDVGSRYYTYLATMGLAMRAAAKRKLRFIVLDRPNPLAARRGRRRGPEGLRVVRRPLSGLRRHG